MRVIVIAARKGGVGKTTLAIHAGALATAPALLVDTDPQKSLAWWWQLREPETPALVECEARELPDLVEVARRGDIETIVVDTPPHAAESIADAMRIADLIVIPTRPGPLDLAAVATTLDLAKRVGKPALAVLNHCPPRTGAAEPGIVTEARQALAAMGAEVAETAISQRVALSHAIISGSTVNEFEPQGRAAGEIAALWSEISERLERPR